MEGFDLETYVRRSRALRTDDIDWESVRTHPLPAEAARALLYMQDVESHTIAYLRTLLSTRAIDDPEIATFLACWLYEETFHGRALARFLREAGHEVTTSRRSLNGTMQRLESALTAMLSRAWPDFVAVHMTWGAINELTTLTAYRRLSELTTHPVLDVLLARITRDESRHFQFYFRQAEHRLQRRSTARLTRLIVDHLWSPVGTGIQPAEGVRFVSGYLFTGSEGRAAARKIDATIRRLPGFEDARLIEGWIERELGAARVASTEDRTSALAA